MGDAAVDVSSSGSCRSRSYSRDRSRSRSPRHGFSKSYESVHRDAISVVFRGWCPLCQKLLKKDFADREEAVNTATRHLREMHDQNHGRIIKQGDLSRRYEDVLKVGNSSTGDCYFEVFCPSQDKCCRGPIQRKTTMRSLHEAYRVLIDHMQEDYEKHPALNNRSKLYRTSGSMLETVG